MGRGFKVTLNLFGGKKSQKHFELAPDLNVTGAYRVHKEDSFGYSSDQQTRRPTEPLSPLRPTKSTGNLVELKTATPNIRNRIPSISQDPRGSEDQGDRNVPVAVPNRKDHKNQEKEQNKLESQRSAKQKAREKQAQEQAKQEKLRQKTRKEALAEQKATEKQAQEHANQEKLREKARKEALAEKKAREKQAQEHAKQEKLREKARKEALAAQKARDKLAQEQMKQEKLKEKVRKEAPKVKSNMNDKKKQAPRPQFQPQTSNVLAAQPPYSTNTLDSSISKTSGPPPYSEMPKQKNSQGSKDKSVNVIYSKPVDTSSWDIINQHRQQIGRPVATAVGANPKPKQMVMDLNYNFGTTSNNTDNSDA